MDVTSLRSLLDCGRHSIADVARRQNLLPTLLITGFLTTEVSVLRTLVWSRGINVADVTSLWSLPHRRHRVRILEGTFFFVADATLLPTTDVDVVAVRCGVCLLR